MSTQDDDAQKKGLNFDLTEQLAFYGAYHRHPVNQLIHFVCVPLILFSILVWLAPVTLPLPIFLEDVVPQSEWNFPLLVVLSYVTFYSILDFGAGLSWAGVVGLPLYMAANTFQHVPHAKAWAGAMHILGWYMQIHPGHMVFEKRKPALMDSISQAFALAPLFVWFELLFLVGYRPDLKRDMQRRIQSLLPEHLRDKEDKDKDS